MTDSMNAPNKLADPLGCLHSRVQSNDNWLKYSENLYREEQKRIGAYARELREGRGLSLRETARRMKVSAPYLSDLERGNRHWT
ncbi:helix-turn-helix domain-containing protein, partial [Cereibacter sphaeroides]|nr:helix-turn-helix domain-containing protein [Cereibacter sphaeroides]